jgi:hypothetical protein
MNADHRAQVQVGDIVEVPRYGKWFRGPVVSFGEKNARVRIVYGNGVERVVKEDRRAIRPAA